MSANAAIYFDPEGYSISGPKLMGRNAAGNSFLTGLFEHAKAKEIGGFVRSDAHYTAFESFCREVTGEGKRTVRIDPAAITSLEAQGCLYLPGPGLGLHARQRRLFGARRWSLCGITHTTLSGRAMDAIAELLTAPIEPWDAVICTSHSVRDTVRAIVEAEAEALSERLGATRFTLPRLPVIPLGVRSRDFHRTGDDHARARQQLGLAPDTIAVLFVGRLSFHAKAHPAPLYEALARAAGGRKVVLIECGWFANDGIRVAFDEAAAFFMPGLRRIVLDGRDPAQRHLAWRAADVFSSLTDNLQETFGITPVEAMAAGIPTVVTDWDGYRDTIRDGIEGFRIPTLAPKPGHGSDLATSHAIESMNYDHFCGTTSQLVSVDIDAATKAFERLFADPALRQRMGMAGQARARQDFDWKTVIARYEALWEDLAEERRSAPDLPPRAPTRHAWPARLDPFTAFASYPTGFVDEETCLVRIPGKTAENLREIRGLASFALGSRMMPSDPILTAAFEAIPTNRPTPLHEITWPATVSSRDQLRIAAWLLKTGTVRAITYSSGPSQA